MAISKATFARALHTMRPGLVLLARRLRRCRHDDAEDLVGQAVLIALQHLGAFDETTGDPGLRRWLRSILLGIIRNEFQRDLRTPPISPLEDALTLPSSEVSPQSAIEAAFDYLPEAERQTIADWLAGYSREEIARRHRLHRNTVSERLDRAFLMIRERHPDSQSLEESIALFAACSRRTVYRKPRASWRPWRDHHPPQRHFYLRRKKSCSG